jgi:hypothetical protein
MIKAAQPIPGAAPHSALNTINREPRKQEKEHQIRTV